MASELNVGGITTTGSVGVGTSPTAIANYTALTVSGAYGGVIDLKSGSTEDLRLLSQSTQSFVGTQSATPLILRTAGAEAMRIDSAGDSTFSGDVIIGQTTGTHKLHVESTNGYAQLKAQSGTHQREWTVDTAGSFYIWQADNSIRPIDVAAAGLVSFSSGIALGNVASATATTLDYYEEGTHVAAITCGTSGTVTLDAAYDELSYTRIGNKMFVSGLLSVASVSSPVGYLNISLPVAAGATGRSSVSISAQGSTSANISDFWAIVLDNQAVIRIHLGDATSVQSDSAEQMIVGSSFRISAQYTV